MAGEVNWKQKYTELKAKYMESVDMAFRLGFEQGAQQASQDAAMQQAQAAQDQAQMAQQGPPGGQGPTGRPEDDQSFTDQQDVPPNVPAGPGRGIEPMQESENPAGSELDQHISALEQMINKSEDLSVDEIKKHINDLKHFMEMKKSAAAIPEIAKALHKPSFKIGVQASHNLTSAAKSAVTMQERIVSDIMQKWEAEEKRASKDILSQLNIEGLTKREE